ncbi:choice-of-anchor P family protein [Amycolatopsis sacchari]|uniref:choice-of-anchor P family protein n=1 Tax=Amycolatopsis sacchari TaxID=115433 RepID=UPI003D738C0E
MARAKRILAAALCLAAVPATAQAEGATATGAGSVGAVHITVDGQQATAEPIAPCAVGGTAENRADPVFVGATTRFGLGSTKCARNADGTASVQVEGARFETNALRIYGGPRIAVRTFKAGCATTANGSTGSVELGSVSGFEVPENIPPNYRITVPGRAQGDPPMAEVVLNELVVPHPPDGSLVTHALHIKLFPQGGPASGDIYVGTAACDPYGA